MARKCWKWCCSKGVILVVLLVNDIVQFPIVHSLWNLIGFEGLWAE